jgi:hypothetical protein
VLQYNWLIFLPVDWSGGHSTPAGSRGHWRPHRRQSAEEAPGPPRGKRVPGAEINRPICRKHPKNLYLNPGKIKIAEKIPLSRQSKNRACPVLFFQFEFFMKRFLNYWRNQFGNFSIVILSYLFDNTRAQKRILIICHNKKGL